MAQTALIVGTSGIVGGPAAERFLGEGWRVYGLARRPSGPDGVTPVAADLQDAEAFATWPPASPNGLTCSPPPAACRSARSASP
jgi:nucleoside-diphosphate-sugar epimerase